MSNTIEKIPSRRRDSVNSSSGSPFRQRRSSLSIATPPSPTMPLSAAASINASMRSGSDGPETTAKDSAASRRSSVMNDIALADDRLPPPAEIAVSDRKSQIPDALGTGAARGSSLGTQAGSAAPLSVNAIPSHHESASGSLSSSPIDHFRSGALRDPFSGAPPEASSGHHRAPSISQVHQEMEQEQEAQVNRLLVTIHQQQTQIDKLQRQLEETSHSDGNPAPVPSSRSSDHGSFTDRMTSASSLGVATPGIEYPPPPTPQRAHSSSSAGTTVASNMPAGRASPILSPSTSGKVSAMHMALSQQSHRAASSRGSSRAASPGSRLARIGSSEDEPSRAGQFEAAGVLKENEALKLRVRELERLLKEARSEGAQKDAPS